ncbi:MAG: hypothetical protein GWN84_12415 [Gammaproteobacteria bacterium]|nr:hypothetical protein [Gammaproteobacteria bacterium]NIR83710.1 hypothetical protein [Gammaproteobacteria bacterium]NIR91857.1 hypothetical protein [Gammaproteobacteria bacterium]NIU04876.1 hypothetical protein [Gammaproteobacteria bacterium]NIV51858.1 hypothetical protein [Gammaproteobacteria bacterium]
MSPDSFSQVLTAFPDDLSLYLATLWDRMDGVVRLERTWTVVSTVSGAVAALAALMAVRQVSVARAQERLTQRPYFAVSAPGIKALPNSPPYRVQLTLENIGMHPAQDVIGKMLFVDKASMQTEYNLTLSLGDEVPARSPTPWQNDAFRPKRNTPEKYIVVFLHYADPLLRKTFKQQFYMQWGGVKEGKIHPDFVHVSRDERKRLSNRAAKLAKRK